MLLVDNRHHLMKFTRSRGRPFPLLNFEELVLGSIGAARSDQVVTNTRWEALAEIYNCHILLVTLEIKFSSEIFFSFPRDVFVNFLR